MNSRASAPARRKAPLDRRNEIVSVATTIALSDGLDNLTIRRVADAMEVYPGLISHYFKSVEDLVVEAFVAAMSTNLEQMTGNLGGDRDPLVRLTELVGQYFDQRNDPINMLWLDAWQSARRRPALGFAVEKQTQAERQQIADLLHAAKAAGQIHTDDADRAASVVLALVDGLIVQASLRSSELDYAEGLRVALGGIEHELGITPGTLRRMG